MRADSRTAGRVDIQTSNPGAGETHTGIFYLPLPPCVISGQSVNISEPEFPHLQMGLAGMKCLCLKAFGEIQQYNTVKTVRPDPE